MSIVRAIREADYLRSALGEDHIPINVERIAQSLRLRVVQEKLDEDISGLLITSSSHSAIVVNSNDSENRRRFTIAHEIGHHILGHQFEEGGHVHVDRGNYISQRGKKASEGVDPKEMEANRFAATLLMPENVVREAVQGLESEVIYDHHVSRLAQAFKVSEQAMTIRLQALGLL